MARLLANHPDKITKPARENITLGPALSKNLPRNGALNAPTNPATENNAAVAAAPAPNVSSKATKKTGSLFFMPPSTVKLIKLRPKMAQP